MNGEFEEDAFSDIKIDGKLGKHKKRSEKANKKKKKQSNHQNPDELSDLEDEENNLDELEVRFAADGLKYIDKDGKVDLRPVWRRLSWVWQALSK